MKVERYKSASALLRKIFGRRVQKISIDAGFTCPNRDGRLGYGGCTYCINSSFTPYYVSKRRSITDQLREGIEFFSRKYKTWKYIAYFQAYSNTYASVDVLRQRYEEALSYPGVIGLDIATRPDCVDEDILDYLAELSSKTFVMIEYGVESTLDRTLERVNRLHTYDQAAWAISETARRGILQSVHLILGLPGETRDDMLLHARRISALPVNILKLHQLQILRGTRMARDYAEHPEEYPLFETVEAYVDFVVDFLELLRPDIYIDRFTNESPPDTVIAPHWGGVKNFEVVHKIEHALEKHGTWQGRRYRSNKQ